jgi:hypothetical protein
MQLLFNRQRPQHHRAISQPDAEEHFIDLVIVHLNPLVEATPFKASWGV